ncbi:hypothetical protein P4C99_12040 [Pontiellaceae bacterium B1224]|nr:hypothetical protein [Pontiellaceae bacterium B1224]
MIKWIVTIICMIGFVLLMNNKKLEMKSIYNDYLWAKGPWAKGQHVDRGRAIMRPSVLPYILEIYSTGQNIEFPEAMIGACDSDAGTARLWKYVDDPETDEFVRTICMAHLLNRDQLRVWSEITDEDIEFISASMPAHVVHWKTLLLKYTGETQSAFRNDTFPERHKFKALFRECIDMYKLKEEQRQQMKMHEPVYDDSLEEPLSDLSGEMPSMRIAMTRRALPTHA